MTLGYDAVMLLGFGGPESTAEVVPFLERVTAGRGIPPERLIEVGEHYFTMGGVSPINAQNRTLRDALDNAMQELLGETVPVVLANRNSAPFVAEVLAELATQGRRRVLAVATSAYSGYSGCRQYREDLAAAQQGCDVEVAIHKLPPYFDLPGFAAAITELLIAALPADLDISADTTRLVFTTHSVPLSLARSAGTAGDAYVAQHRAVAAAVSAAMAAATGVSKPWDLVFQSRSGPPQVPWLEPDVNDALVDLGHQGATAVVLVPIGFLSDHMEVIWDLDTQAMQTAQAHGIRLIRTPTVGVHPRFVLDLAGRIADALRQGPVQTSIGDLCHGDCCLNPRSQAPVVPSCHVESQVMEA